MGEIQVDFTSLDAGRQGLQQLFGRLEATLDELEQGLAPMLETWTGNARDQYSICKKAWDTAAAELAAVLNTVTQSVGEAHDNYSSTHNATVQIWS